MNLTEYFLPLWRRWWLILAALIVATASSWYAAQAQPPIYQARTTLLVGRALQSLNPSNNDLYLTEQLANGYADAIKRPRLRSATMDALGLTQLPDYTVRVVPNTQLIELAVTDTSAQRAEAVANELANQLVKLSPAGADEEGQPRQAFINQQLDDLEASIKSTREEITTRQGQLQEMFSARQIADGQSQIDALQNKLTALQANYAALLQSTQRGASNTISVFDPATLPTEPIGPNRMMIVAMGVAISLALAVSAVYILDFLDDTLKTPGDVQKTLNLVTLGSVPDSKDLGQPIGRLSTSSPFLRESYNILRTNLQFATIGEPLNLLLVTSPVPFDGKSLTSANLATTLAEAGQRVILVDCDLRRPRAQALFGLNDNLGLTTALLQNEPDLDAILQKTEVPGLRVLTSGPLPPNPPAILSSQPMRKLLAALRATADIVILDSPPVAAFADAAILATEADAVLLVVNAGQTRREAARRGMEALGRVHARVIGVLLNRVPMRDSTYAYYRHYSSINTPDPVDSVS